MKFPIDQIIYIDIETVSEYAQLSLVPERKAKLWQLKVERSEILRSLSADEAYTQKAAIFAEFGKVICISIAYYAPTPDEYRMKSFSGHEEAVVLSEFANFCQQLPAKYSWCGHNIREFDIPYICRRMLIQGIAIPSLLDFQNKKPWEIEIYDTMHMWRFGDFKNYTSLDTLTTVFDIPSSKDDIDGSMVGHVYWHENNLERIVQYCQNDVVALIQLARRMNQLPLIDLQKIKNV